MNELALDLLGSVVHLEIADDGLHGELARLTAGLPPGEGEGAVWKLEYDTEGRLFLTEDGLLVRGSMDALDALRLTLWRFNRVAASSARFAVVHAGVAARDGRGVLLPAARGTGKSTLVAALARRGLAMLSDEYAAVELDSGAVHPYGLALQLDDASLDLLGMPPSNGAGEAGGRNWFTTGDLTGTAQPSPAAAALIVFLRRRPGPAVLEPVPSAGAVTHLARHTLNLGPRSLPALRRIALGAPAYNLAYEGLTEAVDIVESLLYDDDSRYGEGRMALDRTVR